MNKHTIIDLSTRRQLWSSEEDAEASNTKSTPDNEIQPERLVMCREFLGFSQADFAEILDISMDLLQSWESGKSLPSVAQLRQIAFVSGAFTVAWFCHSDESGWPGIEQTSLRFHGETEKKKPVQRDQQQSEHDPLGWAKGIPGNVGVPTYRKPDKCTGCATPIWRWYQPDPSIPGEWRDVNCLLHAIIYDKAGPTELTLEACNPTGVYRDEYPWFDGEE